MLSDGGAKSRLSGNVDGRVMAIEEGRGRYNTDLVLGDVGGGLNEGGHIVHGRTSGRGLPLRYRSSAVGEAWTCSAPQLPLGLTSGSGSKPFLDRQRNGYALHPTGSR